MPRFLFAILQKSGKVKSLHELKRPKPKTTGNSGHFVTLAHPHWLVPDLPGKLGEYNLLRQPGLAGKKTR